MAGQNNSLSQVGATSYRNPVLDFLQPKSKIQSSVSTPGFIGPPAPNMSVVPQKGTNPGLITPHNPPTPSSAVKKHTTTDVAGNTTTTEYHAPLPPDDPSNKYNTATGEINKNYKDPNIQKPATNSPVSNIETQNKEPEKPDTTTTDRRINGVLNAGQFTSTEKGLIEGSAVNDASKALQDLQTKYNKHYADIRTAPGVSLSDKVGEEAVYAGQNAQNLQSAQEAYSRAVSNQGQLLGAAQNQAGRASSAAGTVFNAGLVSPTTQGQATFSPLNGYQDGSDQFGNPNDPASGVAVQSYKDMYDKYNTGNATLTQAEGIEDQIANTLLTNPDINNQPLSLLTNLNQYLSGQIGSAPQQLLAQQVNNYIKTLGLDPSAVVSIATQQKGSLKQLLKSLKDTATNNNNALKETADKLKNSSSGSSGGTTGGDVSGANPWH